MTSCPRLMIAGLGGDTGKTSVSVGLCRLWNTRAYKVIPFKKGPDYIDRGWLSRAAHHPCYNVDLFLMNKDQVLCSFQMNTRNADIAVIEGNRGIYDGMDLEGSFSGDDPAKDLFVFRVRVKLEMIAPDELGRLALAGCGVGFVDLDETEVAIKDDRGVDAGGEEGLQDFGCLFEMGGDGRFLASRHRTWRFFIKV